MVQATIVALIAAIGGVLGTLSVKYVDYNAAIKQREVELAELRSHVAGLIRERDALRTKAAAYPNTVLLTGKTSLVPSDCYKRLEAFQPEFRSGNMDTTYDGNIQYAFGVVNVRVACAPSGNVLAVTVSSNGGSIDEVSQVALKIKTLLEQ